MFCFFFFIISVSSGGGPGPLKPVLPPLPGTYPVGASQAPPPANPNHNAQVMGKQPPALFSLQANSHYLLLALTQDVVFVILWKNSALSAFNLLSVRIFPTRRWLHRWPWSNPTINAVSKLDLWAAAYAHLSFCSGCVCKTILPFVFLHFKHLQATTASPRGQSFLFP